MAVPGYESLLAPQSGDLVVVAFEGDGDIAVDEADGRPGHQVETGGSEDEEIVGMLKVAILCGVSTLGAPLPLLARLVHLSIFRSEEGSRLDLTVGGGLAHLRFLQHRLNLLISLCLIKPSIRIDSNLDN